MPSHTAPMSSSLQIGVRMGQQRLGGWWPEASDLHTQLCALGTRDVVKVPPSPSDK